MNRFLGIALVAALITALGFGAPASADYRQHPEAERFVTEMTEHHGFDEAQMRAWMAEAERQDGILEAIARPAERTRTWAEYRPIFLQPLRVTRGVEFWQSHRDAFERAEATYGVPPEVILAIIGVETNYGRTMGSHRVIDALTTLAFDYPPRAPFFRRELEQYFILMREQKQNPLAFKGSYAGAMGFGQFMPSSYRHYAVDFDGDGLVDIWHNPTDAIGSVANYFAEHGWQRDGLVAVRARAGASLNRGAKEDWNRIEPPEQTVKDWQARGLVPIFPLPGETPANALALEGDFGEEFWLAFQNFYVITRYNRSHLYALAVQQLSQAIKTAMETQS
ncbi:lytic murein transglycosylase B [Marinimicrobium agarilyticum]|uniref:lytic murein transglycosylase B n=1 Tax=Marinimicrobium agarilyticum TaxID=306546 RepID=UPI000429BE23|nr:lytic murein transglycosylase B [Marinimicrobium agarilyticum]